MTPVFEKSALHAGWLEESSGNLFSADMRWSGFVYAGNVYAANGQWLGGFRDGSFLDRLGKPVAWLQGIKPRGCGGLSGAVIPPAWPEPAAPAFRPCPAFAAVPETPAAGWSELTWQGYLKQK